MGIKFGMVDGESARAIDPESLSWPDSSIVAFAIDEDSKEVVNRLGIISLPHMEGLLSANGTVKELVELNENYLKENGATMAHAYTLKNNLDLQTKMRELGYKKVPVDVWLKKLGD